MGERDRNESGQFADRIPPESVLDVFANREDFGLPLTAQDVADGLGIARRTAHNKLTALEETGQLATRKVGARGRVWWVPIDEGDLAAGADALPDSRERREAGEEPAESDEVVDTASDTDRRERPSGARDEADSATAEIDALVDEVADDVLPGSGEKLEERREALRAVVHYLRDHGTATPKEFRRDVYPDHPAQYTEGNDPPYSWWTNAMYEGMSELASRSDDVGAADSSGEWRWRGD